MCVIHFATIIFYSFKYIFESDFYKRLLIFGGKYCKNDNYRGVKILSFSSVKLEKEKN